jgi:hypothetical protein
VWLIAFFFTGTARDQIRREGMASRRLGRNGRRVKAAVEAAYGVIGTPRRDRRRIGFAIAEPGLMPRLLTFFLSFLPPDHSIRF